MTAFVRRRRRRSTPSKLRLPDIPVRKSLPLPAVLGERVLWQARACQLENVRDFFTCFLAAIPAVAVGLFVDPFFYLILLLPGLGVAWRWLEVTRKSYQLSETHLRVIGGVFRRRQRAMDLLAVTEMTVKAPVVQQRCGRGSLRVRGSQKELPSITLLAIRNPEETKAAIWLQVEKLCQEMEPAE